MVAVLEHLLGFSDLFLSLAVSHRDGEKSFVWPPAFSSSLQQGRAEQSRGDPGEYSGEEGKRDGIGGGWGGDEDGEDMG